MIPTQYKCMRGCIYRNWVFTTLKSKPKYLKTWRGRQKWKTTKWGFNVKQPKSHIFLWGIYNPYTNHVLFQDPHICTGTPPPAKIKTNIKCA